MTGTYSDLPCDVFIVVKEVSHEVWRLPERSLSVPCQIHSNYTTSSVDMGTHSSAEGL